MYLETISHVIKSNFANAIIKNKYNNALTRLININKVNINTIG